MHIPEKALCAPPPGTLVWTGAHVRTSGHRARGHGFIVGSSAHPPGSGEWRRGADTPGPSRGESRASSNFADSQVASQNSITQPARLWKRQAAR
eukprot:scaffold7500_cov127-Isochrysis_galbana.AAC.24